VPKLSRPKVEYAGGHRRKCVLATRQCNIFEYPMSVGLLCIWARQKGNFRPIISPKLSQWPKVECAGGHRHKCVLATRQCNRFEYAASAGLLCI
jgi:hypothetical protein